MKKIFYLLLITLLIFFAYLIIHALSFKSIQLNEVPVARVEIPESAIQNIANSLKIKTVSPEDPLDFDSAAFKKFSEFLKTTYPLADSILQRKTINSYSFLYTWKGTEDSMKPVVLMAHLDVVPAPENELTNWKHHPFEGKIVNDTLWGRGAIDDKIGVIGIMEAVEYLLNTGFRPKRTIYIAFGHDEEIGGANGAVEIASYLEEQGVKAEFVLDEGGSIVQGMVPGIEKDVALIGIAEKGFVSLELSVEVEGGHSSMPKEETAIDIISNAISKLRQHPFPASLTPPLIGFIDNLGPEMPFLNRIVFANRTVFSSLIVKIYAESTAGNALVRNTMVPTIFNSGEKDNLVPQSAKATINFRILPGSSIKAVTEHVISVINDERIQITQGEFASEPSASSSTNSNAYGILNKSIVQTFPHVLTAPNLVIGATDSRHYERISSDVYRFLPIYINDDNIRSFHGLNERIAVEDVKTAIRFYIRLIENCN
jgi:carboxypeptidase PM20D1